MQSHHTTTVTVATGRLTAQNAIQIPHSCRMKASTKVEVFDDQANSLERPTVPYSLQNARSEFSRDSPSRRKWTGPFLLLRPSQFPWSLPKLLVMLLLRKRSGQLSSCDARRTFSVPRFLFGPLDHSSSCGVNTLFCNTP